MKTYKFFGKSLDVVKIWDLKFYRYNLKHNSIAFGSTPIANNLDVFNDDLYVGNYIDEDIKYITNNPDLQLVWIAYSDASKLAYLPARKMDGYKRAEDKDAYLTKNGKMLSYGKFCTKFGTSFFPQPCSDSIQIEDCVEDVYMEKDAHFKSCMVGKSHLVDFYDEMKCKIITARDCEGRLTGRAILWPEMKCFEGGLHKVLDRIYGNSEMVKDAIRAYAVKNGIDVKVNNGSDCTEFESGRYYYTTLVRDSQIPWMDTFLYYSNGKIYNDPCESDKELQNTDGSNVYTYNCAYCGCELSDDDIIIDAYGNEACDNCVIYVEGRAEHYPEDQVMFCHATNEMVLINDEDYQEVGGEIYPIDGDFIRYDEYDEKWIMAYDAVYCESEEMVTHIDNATVCEICGEFYINECTEECEKERVTV